MNTESLNENVYSVVGLDGKERTNVNLDTIKEWYFKKEINESSLIFSIEIGQWQMLKKVFNLEELKVGFMQRNQTNSYNPNTFANPPIQNTAIAPSFPEHFPTTNKGNSNYTGYTTENHYNQRTLPPRQPTNYYNQAVTKSRAGFRLVAIFLVTNLIIWFISIFLSVFLNTDDSTGTTVAYKLGQKTGEGIIKIIIDLYLFSRLWNSKGEDNTGRIFVIIRTYLGSILFLPIVFMFFPAGFYLAGLTGLGSIVFYAIGLLILLHGKESPSPSRINIGWISFALFIVFSILAMYSSATIISNSSKNSQAFNDLNKYELPSNEFIDSQTPVKIILPVGWKQYSLQNPHITDPNARMIATDSTGNKGAKFTVYPFPRKMEISKSQLSMALDKAVELAEPKLKAEDSSYKTILSNTIYLKDKIAKRIIFERQRPGKNKKTKGNMIFTMDGQNAYVLEMWCDEDAYESAIKDFTQFEDNFSFREM